jgi:NifU-like protein
VVFVYSVSPIYPKSICERLRTGKRRRSLENPDATGVAIALECGTNIKYYLSINDASGEILKIAFRSNGCGYLLAAADTIAEILTGKDLTELHGLRPEELSTEIRTGLGEWPLERRHCIATTVDAIQNAFAEYRRSRIKEFTGERALICTCFGVSEEKIENAIQRDAAHTLEDVGRLTNAGTGCGSCQMLIRELIDAAADGPN